MHMASAPFSHLRLPNIHHCDRYSCLKVTNMHIFNIKMLYLRKLRLSYSPTWYMWVHFVASTIWGSESGNVRAFGQVVVIGIIQNYLTTQHESCSSWRMVRLPKVSWILQFLVEMAACWHLYIQVLNIAPPMWVSGLSFASLTHFMF